MKCKHCKERPVGIQSRGLCMPCYRNLRNCGLVKKYPKKDLYLKRLKKRYKGILKDFKEISNNSEIARKHGFTRELARQIRKNLLRYSDKGNLCELISRES
jgi:hypothetical protein